MALSSRRKKMLWVGLACIAVAACVTVVWWPYLNVRMSKWSSDDPTEATVVRAVAFILGIIGVFLLSGAIDTRGER
jgi:hypothetical protein